MAGRLNFEIDHELETGLIIGHAGVPGLIEAVRQTGTVTVIDREVKPPAWAERVDSALYKHELLHWLDEQAIGCAISADMRPQLAECITAPPKDHRKLDREETDAIRERVEVNYRPSDGIWHKEAVSPRRCLAIRTRPRQGELLRDSNHVHHFRIVTNRSNAVGGSGFDLIR